jgi:serine/threonine protein kinase
VSTTPAGPNPGSPAPPDPRQGQGQPTPAKYVPKRKIRAVGSYYSVYEATQVGLDRPVELRVLNCKPQRGSPELARFQHEFSTLANLDHPGLIRVLDLGVMADHVFYVTDLRNARSYQELLDKGRTFAVEESIAAVRAVVSALGHLHRRNVLHRDLSASTVYMDLETGNTYIAEFSLVKNLNVQGLTMRGIPTLKLLGRTPEALAGAPYDHRTDLYQAGAFLYRLLTQAEPPTARPIDSPAAPAGEGFHPRAINPRVPPDLDLLVVKALAQRPEDRHQSAEDLVADLDRIAEKLEVKSMLTEIVETTMTDLRVVRPPPPKKGGGDTTVEMKRSDLLGLEGAPSPARASPAETTVILTPAAARARAAGGSPAGAGTIDPLMWLRAHREYAYLAAGPAAVLLLVALLFALHTPEDETGTPGGQTGSGRSAGGGRGRTAPVAAVAEARDYGPDVKKVAAATSRSPSSKENFHHRWYLLDNWVKQMASQQKTLPFSAGELVSVRISFYRDEGEACQKLDGLYEKADRHLKP